MSAALKILVVEDEFHIAAEIANALRARAISVVGPVPSVDAAMNALAEQRVDGAILDLNLQGQLAYPVADALAQRRIPFVIASGYDMRSMPSRYRLFPRIEKPFDADNVIALWDRIALKPKAAAQDVSRNKILSALKSADLERLLAVAEPISLAKGAAIGPRAPREMHHCHFLTAGVAVCEAQSRDRDMAALGLIGRDGVTNLQTVEADIWPRLTYRMLVAGEGLRVRFEDLSALRYTAPSIEPLLVAFRDQFLIEAASSLVGGVRKSVDERVANWLLLLAAKSERDVLPVTHEDISVALGARRAGVTGALNALQGLGYVELNRAEIVIRDRQGLEKAG